MTWQLSPFCNHSPEKSSDTEQPTGLQRLVLMYQLEDFGQGVREHSVMLGFSTHLLRGSFPNLSVLHTHVYVEHEQEKRRAYNQRVLQIEHGSFTPLVFSIFGGMSPECNRFYSRLSLLLSEKRNENQSLTTSWVRCRISFSLLRSALLCMRGSRTAKPQTATYDTTISLVADEARLS